MKINNTELRLIVEMYKSMKVTKTVNIHGRLFVSCPSKDSVDRIDFENEVINLNIVRGKFSIEDNDNVLEYLKILKPSYSLIDDRDFLWLGDVEFNQTTIDGVDYDKEEFFSQLLIKYMRSINTSTLDIFCTIKERYNSLILFDDGTVYREYVDIDTDPEQPYLLLFEDTLVNMLKKMDSYVLLGISPNYEVHSKDKYLKQLGRISCLTPFKFRVVESKSK